MKIMFIFLLAVMVLGAMPRPADAIIMCISQQDTDRCHPEDGTEPPADCGYPGFWRGLGEWAHDQMDALAARFGGDADALELDD